MRAITNPDPLAAAGRLPFFIPGTSMRGAWRAHLERILRSLDPPETARVCDPLDDDPDEKTASPYYRACSAVLTEEKGRRIKSHQAFVPYRLSCPVCRLFGNTTQASRLSISDGELTNGNENRLVSREHVRIDRKSGRVAQGALIKYFGLQGAQFRVEIQLRNFELQHLRLVGALLKDIAIGAVPLGSGKNKGYGQVKGKFEEIHFTYFGLNEPDGLVRGVAENADAGMAQWFAKRYGVAAATAPPLFPPGEWTAATPWRFARTVTPEEFEAIWQKAPLPWNEVPMLKSRMAEA
jgi:CRISPR/Cas system CSM-associated protein Csm3 (group 7 of RAMP superfamily)